MPDQDLPRGTRTNEEFTVHIGPNLVFHNVPCPDPLAESKKRWQTHLGLEPVIGDPNSTEPHTDTIKTALLFKMQSVLASPEEKEQARALFAQLYPRETLKPVGETNHE